MAAQPRQKCGLPRKNAEYGGHKGPVNDPVGWLQSLMAELSDWQEQVLSAWTMTGTAAHAESQFLLIIGY
jgi:hypothetical protein